jgi:hypothetical protein
MWIFNKTGCMSIVFRDCEDDELLVKARVRHDLVKLCKELNIEPKISEEGGLEHFFTMPIKRHLLAKYLSDYIHAIRYPNVRHNITEPNDHLRRKIYLKVWEAGMELAKMKG